MMRSQVVIILVSMFWGIYTMTDVFAQPQRTYEQRIDQVKLYMQEKLYKQAKIELENLLQTEKGSTDVRVLQSLAIIAYKQDKVTLALKHIQLARKISYNEEEHKVFSNLYQQWIQEYGLVQFVSQNELQQGSIDLKRTRRIINQKRNKVFLNVQKELQQGIPTPHHVYLPYGTYIANQVKFKLKRNEQSPIVKLLLTPLAEPLPTKSKDKKSKLSTWFYVGIGVTLATALSIGGYYLLDDDAPPPKRFSINASLK